jgi:hypothetical protein
MTACLPTAEDFRLPRLQVEDAVWAYRYACQGDTAGFVANGSLQYGTRCDLPLRWQILVNSMDLETRRHSSSSPKAGCLKNGAAERNASLNCGERQRVSGPYFRRLV